MARTKKLVIGGLVAVMFVFVANGAFAQNTPGGGGGAGAATQGSGNGGDYGYKFDDDPLSAGGFGPNDARILVRPQAARTTLIRPRTSFVPEMLKSVENI
jgi:hypothetical protein